MPDASTEIVGREQELAEIEGFLEGAGPAFLLIEGEAGIGKSTLWRAATGFARARGREVLLCEPSQREQSLAFASLTDLLGGALDEVTPCLPPPQRRALEVALLLADPEGAPVAPRDIAVATLTALKRLSDSRPVALAVDDVQWLDSASADALEFALRRLDGAGSCSSHRVAVTATRLFHSGSDARHRTIVSAGFTSAR